MKVIKNILFTFAMVIGLSLAISAQKGEQKKPPPKGPPPVINPAPPKNPPSDSKKPKKPSYRLAVSPTRIDGESD